MKTEQKWAIGNGLELLDEQDKQSVTLIVLDLPYYGVVSDEWDNLWKNLDEYLNWCKQWFIKSERCLKDNGTLYYFNSQFKVIKAVDTLIESSTKLKFRQFITIDKGLQSVAGRVSEALRSYPKASEFLTFYTFDDFTGAEMLSDEISSRNPMAKYLLSEIQRAGVTQGELRALFPSKTGNETGCITNWVKGYNCPLKWQYELIRTYLNSKGDEYLRKEYEYLRKEYEDLRKEYEYLRKEYEDLRYPFNSMSGFTDTWQFDFYKEKRYKHPTQKPFSLIERIVLTSSNEGDLVIDPAMGTGTTFKVCKAHNRNFNGRELNPDYEKDIISRAMVNTPRLDSWIPSKEDA